MATQEIGRRVLARAAAQLGGVEALAVRLDLSHRVLQRYIIGDEPIPDSLFFRAVDVILAELPDPAKPAQQTTPSVLLAKPD
jgi:hypothetical protein